MKQARIDELEAELKAAAKVRDAWCREYVKVRDALKGLLLCLEGEFDGEKLAQATNRATAAMRQA